MVVRGTGERSTGGNRSRGAGTALGLDLSGGEIFLWFVALTTLTASAGRVSIAGVRLCGIMWVLVCIAGVFCVLNGQRASWAVGTAFSPFLVYVLARSDLTSPDHVQTAGSVDSSYCCVFGS